MCKEKNLKNLLSLIILYFSYIGGIVMRSIVVSYGFADGRVSDTTPLNGGHSRKNLPEFDMTQTKWEKFSQTQGEM